MAARIVDRAIALTWSASSEVSLQVFSTAIKAMITSTVVRMVTGLMGVGVMTSSMAMKGQMCFTSLLAMM